MIKREHLRFCKGDFLAVAAVIILALLVAAFYLPKDTNGAVMAQIYQSGELIKTVSLAEDASFQVTGKYTNVVTVHDGSISITESNCPGEDCVHSGAIHASGRSVVCLPNEVEVRVVNSQSDVDFVVG